MRDERSGLDRKNRLYSIVLAVILLGGLIGYFLCMLPSLYVSYRKEQNLSFIKRQHQAYTENRGYGDIQSGSFVTCYTIEIPYEGDTVFISGQSWTVEVTAEKPQARSALSELRELLHRYRREDFTEESDGERIWEEMEGLLAGWGEQWEELSESLPVRVNLQVRDRMEYVEGSIRVHFTSDDVPVIETEVSDKSNIYTNYIAMEDTGEALIVTFLPVMTPDMDEIRPVVLQSIPMLAAVVLLLVLLFSQMYSRGILRPVYRELEEKNQALEEENKRQEIFMRASSHQLKTPLSAALLLLDGMISRVGRYTDTAVYLPRVKEQLLSMRKMVEDILSLNHCRDNFELREMKLMPLLEARLSEYKVKLQDKGLQISCSGEDAAIRADEYLMMQILDNLISNAVEYTPEGNRIEVRTGPGAISIENFGVTIPKDILPHVFDPFVSGNHEREMASHGLGLYIAAYYAKQMDFSVEIENREESVLTVLHFS